MCLNRRVYSFYAVSPTCSPCCSKAKTIGTTAATRLPAIYYVLLQLGRSRIIPAGCGERKQIVIFASLTRCRHHVLNRLSPFGIVSRLLVRCRGLGCLVYFHQDKLGRVSLILKDIKASNARFQGRVPSIVHGRRFEGFLGSRLDGNKDVNCPIGEKKANRSRGQSQDKSFFFVRM
jgi:hypothetical protein